MISFSPSTIECSYMYITVLKHYSNQPRLKFLILLLQRWQYNNTLIVLSSYHNNMCYSWQRVASIHQSSQQDPISAKCKKCLWRCPVKYDDFIITVFLLRKKHGFKNLITVTKNKDNFYLLQSRYFKRQLLTTENTICEVEIHAIWKPPEKYYVYHSQPLRLIKKQHYNQLDAINSYVKIEKYFLFSILHLVLLALQTDLVADSLSYLLPSLCWHSFSDT